ncbi:MAG: hypothetical protein JRJ59_10140 [Deltaproteobacteria bacterium]|nr:hypothetical protein [Deltaproteobacteria bacterium]
MTGERAINTVTGDYELVPGGDFAVCDDLGNEVYKRTIQEQGASALEPDVGRAQRRRVKDTEAVRQQLLRDIEQSLKPILDAGRAEKIEVQEDASRSYRPGRMAVIVETTQAGGRKNTYNLWVPVN